MNHQTVSTETVSPARTHALPRADLTHLIELLRADGYRVIGPTVRDGAIVYDEIEGARDLPVGWTDEQAPGRYRLRRRDDDACFGYAVGPHSWKRFLFPPRETLVRIRRSAEGPAFDACVPGDDQPPLALLGVRSCDLHAIAVQDRVFLGGALADPRYGVRRDRCLIVAVSCLEPGGLCFCASMGTGPRVESGFDLCLSELPEGLLAGQSLAGQFLIEAGSEAGQGVLDRLSTRPATADELRRRDQGIDDCRARMGRTLDTHDLPGLLLGNLDHARWDEVATRCLSCGNCTLVCPTCFCSTVEDRSDLVGEAAARERVWDSCFTQDHSRIHGAEFRPTIKDRYRQWLTHKLDSWYGQFGTSGCVGCGRCIAWCPVGIDITEEVAAVRLGATTPVALPAPAISGAPAAPAHVHDDPMLPVPVRLHEVRRETADVVTLYTEAPPGFAARPGQFDMLSLPAIGEVPISISGFETADILAHTIRGVGAVTNALIALTPGDTIGMRGPYGTGWPLAEAAGGPVIVIAGGIGLAPLRGALREMAARAADFPSVRLLYGTRTPDDILYPDELLAWNQAGRIRASVTVDRALQGWHGHVGVVTRLMEGEPLPPEATYLVCGPEVMMRFAIEALQRAGVPEPRIYLSMERNMKCAAGFCGRCQYGPYFICKDGPVFRHDQISFLFGHPGF